MQNIIAKKQYQIDFAPVQGYTDFIYRKVHSIFFEGINSYYTPFQRIPQRNKDKKDVASEHNDIEKTVPQIIGGDAEEMSFLLNYLKNLGYKRADINFGCPFKMITNRGRGAGCFNDIKKFRTLFNFPKGMDISLKMRLGWDQPSQILEILPYINDAKLHSVTVHARIGIQEYKGDVDMETFEKVYKNCTHPLFYNGDIRTRDNANKILMQFPNLSGLVIGRGLLEDPALAFKIIHQRDKNCKSDFSGIYKTFHDELLKEYKNYLEGGDAQILQKMKTLWDYFLPEIDKKLRKKIKKCRKLEEYNQITRIIFNVLNLKSDIKTL